MIINIRGTGGSGKTWVMRRIIDSIAPLDKWEAQYVPGRKKPETYRYEDIYVLGHYESVCGGCDNIRSAKSVYELINRVLEQTPLPLILCEGMLLSEDFKWMSQLEDVRIFFLSTSIEDCLANIRNRRKEQGNEKELSEYRTRARLPPIESARRRLTEAGVDCRRVTSEQAVEKAIKLVKEWRKRG